MLFGKIYSHSKDQQQETVAIPAAEKKKKEQVIPYKLLFIHKLLFIIICNYFTI